MRYHQIVSETEQPWSEDDLRSWAADVRGDNDDGSPAYFDPDEGDWHYDPSFPMDKFAAIMPASKWKEWIANEIEMFKADLGHDRGYTAMMSENITEPVVISIYNRRPYIWDGYHRVGVSFAKGARTIKAIVGVRRQ